MMINVFFFLQNQCRAFPMIFQPSNTITKKEQTQNYFYLPYVALVSTRSLSSKFVVISIIPDQHMKIWLNFLHRDVWNGITNISIISTDCTIVIQVKINALTHVKNAVNLQIQKANFCLSSSRKMEKDF